MADFHLINSIAISCLPSLVQSWVPGGSFKGNEYVVKNPNRSNSKAKAFSINTATGVWKDFSNGDGGKDPISLYAYIYHLEYFEAAKQLLEILHIDSTTKHPPPTKAAVKEVWTPVLPVPPGSPGHPTTFVRKEDNDWVNYEFVAKWTYLNSDGTVLGYDIKIVNSLGNKEILPLTYCKNKAGEYKWKFIHFKGKRPLYNLNRIFENLKAIIIVVEGCKCAEALQKLLDSLGNTDYVVTTWPGGCKSVKNVDWSTLKGREIIVWPDNDRQHYKDKPDVEKPKEEQEGYLAAITILQETAAIVKSQILIDVPGTDKPHTWDVADAIDDDKWTLDQVLSFIKSNSKEQTPHQNTEKPTPTYTPPPFRCLGYSGSHRYYLDDKNKITSISEGGHTSLMLMNLAPKSFWKALFYKDGDKVNWEDAADYLQNHPDSRQVFSLRKCRGRGACIDKGRIIYHLGEQLIVDSKLVEALYLPDSEYIYEGGEKIHEDLEHPLPDDEAKKLSEIIEKLHFIDEIQPILLSGFIALAPICGALDWRPHIHLTGGPGTGKSTVFEKVVIPCINSFKIFAASDTTAPGLRQTINLDAIPVVIDECEGQDEKSKKNIQEILKLARQSSSGKGSRVIKGSASHKSVEFEPRSMFLFGSTGVNISERADETRISIIELMIPKKMSQDERNIHWENLEKEILKTITPQFCASLRSRTILNTRAIIENCKTLSKAVSEKLTDKRAGDQYGALIAGYYSLHSTKVLDIEGARDLVKLLDFNTTYDKGREDERKLLDFILQHTFKIDPTTELSVEEIIEKITVKNQFAGLDDTQIKLYELLKRNGIRIDNAEADLTKWIMWISDSHGGIGRILEETAWPKKWGIILKRLPKSISKTALRFIGSATRATGIPLEEVL